MKTHLGWLHTACKRKTKKTHHLHLSIAASGSCGTYKSNGRDPEGSGNHDDEGLGAAGCQQDAFVSERVPACVCVCERVSVVSRRNLAVPVSRACWMWWVEALMAMKMSLHSKSRNLHRKRWGIREGRNQAVKQFGVKILAKAEPIMSVLVYSFWDTRNATAALFLFFFETTSIFKY